MSFLPAVYRDNPEAEDFTERFLSLFDASIADLDRTIERAPALLDPRGVPDDLLPWLARLLDLTMDPAWGPARRRMILRAMPRLYRLRGTRRGLSRAVRLVFGVRPVIEELSGERSWGALASGCAVKHGEPARGTGAPATLGAARLFGRARARLRLGRSVLGSTPIFSYGDPDQDPLYALAHRFRVLFPAAMSARTDRAGADATLARLRRLVEAQKPAHTVATVRGGGEGFILGIWSATGVDTALTSLPAPVLGGPAGNVRLRRTSVLRPGRAGIRRGITLGNAPAVGVTTVLQ